MKDLFDVSDMVVVVTGAGRGNGKAIADGYLSRGATVCGVDVHFDSVSNHDKWSGIRFDLTQHEKLPQWVETLKETYGRVDVLVNNAGVSLGSDIPYSAEVLDKTWAINLKAAYTLSHEIGKLMVSQKSGSIINITSLGAGLGFPDNPSYQVSKAALKQFTKALAVDLGKHGVRANNVCPGYIKTEMTQKSFKDDSLRKVRSERMILGRWGRSEDLVGACIFLSSQASAYVTGTDILVDGGWSAKGL
jgi:NAD(P)-dependent dehydrogenase (short-subunit alcohol dehydrogenase family)